MSILLILAYLFFIGSLLGWLVEVLFRHFFSGSNPTHKWINPGFCVGPYLPIYGVGLCLLYVLAILAEQYSIHRLIMFILMALVMTFIEYIGGLFFLKFMNVRLWDYSELWGNIQGLICPLFSFFWAVLSAIYYFCIHDYVLEGLAWLAHNLAFSFFIGFFFGIFVIDLCYSSKIISKLKQFAKENELIANIEVIKATIPLINEEIEKRTSFFFPLHHISEFKEKLIERKEKFEQIIKKR